MKIGPKITTFALNSLLTLIGVYLGYEFGIFYLFPIFFSLGTPIINVKGDIWLKLKIASIITISVTAILLITVGASFSFGFILIPVFLSGLAGGLTLWIFSLLVENVKPNWVHFCSTVIFCMVPLVVADELLHSSSYSRNFITNFAILWTWSLLISVAISLSLKRHL